MCYIFSPFKYFMTVAWWSIVRKHLVKLLNKRSCVGRIIKISLIECFIAQRNKFYKITRGV